MLTHSNTTDPSGTVAWVDAGDTVYLDGATDDLSMLLVKGNLVFDHCFNSAINASCILVIDEGTLQIGSAVKSFKKNAEINLIDWPVSASRPTNYWIYSLEVNDALADRGLVVANGGKLRMYGKDRGTSWTRLDQTADANTTDLTTITPALSWVSGDQIVIASTDFDQNQAETGNLVAPTTSQIKLQTGLANQHWGILQNFGPSSDWEVDERAEIGLLNRNVKIAGELASGASYDYGHVFLCRDDLPSLAALPQIEISWVEFKNLGVGGVSGRYPVHFHDIESDPLDPARLLFIENSSIRDTFNRGIVVHMTNEVRIENNVVYNTMGHGIYLEDGTVENCDVLDNLSLVNWVPTEPEIAALVDSKPGNITLRSLKNDVQGNVAGGSAAYGIYLDLYNLPFSPTGMVFANNSAHSCEKIGIYENNELDPSALITFTNSRVWKCREYGMWIRSVRDYVVEGLVAADCRSGFYPASKGLRNAGEGSQVLRNGLFVGETDNLGKPITLMEQAALRSLPQQDNFLYAGEPNAHELEWDTLNGVEVYDGFIQIENCRFAEFVDLDLVSQGFGYRWAAGLTQVAKVSTWINDPRNRVTGLLFDATTVPRRAHFRNTANGNNQIAFTTIVDEDSSLGYGANTILMPDTSFLTWNQGAAVFSSALNGWSVPLNSAQYGQLAVRLNNINPQNPQNDVLQRTSWRRVEDPLPVIGTQLGDIWYSDTVPTEIDFGGDDAFVFPVVVEVGDDDLPPEDVLYYRMAYHSSITSGFPAKLRVSFRFAPYYEDPILPDEPTEVFLEIPYDNNNGPGSVTYRDEFNAQVAATSVTTLSDLLGSQITARQAYYWSGTVLYLKLTSQVKDNEDPDVYGTQLVLEIVE